MKKIIYFLIAFTAIILTGCSSDLNGNERNQEIDIHESHQTKVYVNGTSLTTRPETRSLSYNTKSELGYSVPIDNKYLVFYFIRIDGNVPCEEATGFRSDEYIPRTSGNKTLIDDANHGFVTADAYWRSNFKFNKYIYSSDGLAVQSVIIEEPDIETLLSSDRGTYHNYSNIIAHSDNYHFLWYICKQQNISDHTWHIDGILITKDRTKIQDTDYGEEIINKYKNDFMDDVDTTVDIHQQDHKDWNEVKTTAHISEATDVMIEIPVENDLVL